MDQTLQSFNERILTLEEKAQEKRAKIVEAHQFINTNTGQIDPTKIEQALNEWLEKVEDQVNSIEEMV